MDPSNPTGNALLRDLETKLANLRDETLSLMEGAATNEEPDPHGTFDRIAGRAGPILWAISWLRGFRDEPPPEPTDG